MNQYLWKEMNKIAREMNQLFGDPFIAKFVPPSFSLEEFPSINMWNNEEEIIITAELPGIDINALNINVLEDALFLQGKRELPQQLEDKEKYCFQRQERMLGSFRRSFTLPFKVETDKVVAKYEKGILEIKLPRSEKEKPRKINIVVS